MSTIHPLLASRLAEAPRGEFVGSAIDRLAKLVNGKDGMETYLSWLKHPMTPAILDAIEEASRQPQGSYALPQPHEIPVQYGITTGLQFAALLFRDPTAVIGGWKPETLPFDELEPSYGAPKEPKETPQETAPVTRKPRSKGQ